MIMSRLTIRSSLIGLVSILSLGMIWLAGNAALSAYAHYCEAGHMTYSTKTSDLLLQSAGARNGDGLAAPT